jgi:glycosyltransferase involved in cell wall biosynthesis
MGARVQLVVPCYNEAGRLKTAAFLDLIRSRTDVVVRFVDDGSADGTGTALAELAAREPERVAVMTLPRNVGKAAAIRVGVLAAFEQQPTFVSYWDADLSTPLSALAEFIDVLDNNPGVDIVMGARVRLLGRQIQRRSLRHYVGRVFATAASLALRLPVYDTQCGAKLFRANERMRQAFAEPFRSKWLVDLEMLARYIGLAGRGAAESSIIEVPLKSWNDVPGSKLHVVSALHAVVDLASIWRQSRR